MSELIKGVTRIGAWFNRRAALLAALTGAAAMSSPGTALAKDAESIDVVKKIILAWRKLDVEGVLSHVSEDIVWYSHVGGKAPFRGKPAMREFITALGKGITDNKWRVFHMAVKDDTVYCEGVDDFKTTDGKHIVVPYLGLMKVRRGVVTEWRDYFDGGLADRMKKGEFDFANDPVVPLLDRPALF
ncbi:MAG: nuclear transport factor 2 family protein [Rhodospirillaceae bacterium]|nr:nuclear transport factor 2 family protein [Rhodospirillaceae bacterium]